MIVEAKCIAQSFESKGARQYFPGFTYPIDLGNPEQRKLADLKTPTGKFVFQFDRSAANDPEAGIYFCTECQTRFDSLNSLGTHMRRDHKRTGWEALKQEPETDAEPEPEAEKIRQPGTNAAGDLRGVSPLKCKGCGEPFGNLHLLMVHKLSCPAKAPEAVSQEVDDVGQATPA